MKFSNKDFFSKCDHISTFTEKILIGKLHFLCSESYRNTKFFPLESLYKLLNSYCKLEVQLCFLSPLRNRYLILQKKKKNDGLHPRIYHYLQRVANLLKIHIAKKAHVVSPLITKQFHYLQLMHNVSRSSQLLKFLQAVGTT